MSTTFHSWLRSASPPVADCGVPTTTERLETYYRSSALRLVFVHAFRPTTHQWLPIWVRHCLGHASPFAPLDLGNDWNNS